VALGCLTVSLRHRDLRRSMAPRTGAIVGLIVFQAVLGGILVKSGTATHWLFLHLGTAAIILSLIVWSLLRSAHAPNAEPVSTADLTSRKRLRRITIATAIVVWIQLMIGALVAGSRAVGHFGSGADNLSHTWPKMYGHFVPPDLWVSANGLPWNLLDNFVLHQWTHRWFAFLVLLHLGLVFWRARLTPIGQRANLALQVAATFLGIQIILGLANVYLGAPVLVALGHLLTANLILVSLVLVIHDLRYEPSCEMVNPTLSKEAVST
jgi:heme a synthase